MTEYNAIQQLSAQAPRHVVSAVQKASARSGVNFSYLLNQAKVESSFNPQAKAKTSSATGLYQFIDSTWMSMIERYGEDYGIDTSGKSRADILALRKDPQAASFMAAAFASENEKFLDAHWGGQSGPTELYLAHFMGASGAASFLNARDENPFQPAADLYPAAARANRAVFYDPDTGKARSLAQVYDFFDRKFAPAQSAQAPQEKIASAPKSYNSLYSPSTQISDHSFMRLTMENREQTVPSNNGFFSLLVKPLDVMLLVQDKSDV